MVPGDLRDERAGLVGTASVLAEADRQVFDVDVDVVWPATRQWAHVPAGHPTPDVPGQAVVRRWG